MTRRRLCAAFCRAAARAARSAPCNNSPLAQPTPRAVLPAAIACKKARRVLAIGLSSSEPANRIAVVDVVRPIQRVLPNDRRGQSKRLVDGRGHVFRRLRIGARITAGLVRGADDRAAAHSAPREEDGLDWP